MYSHENPLILALNAADGSQLVAGVGARVLIYDASDGELQHVLKGHKVRNSWHPASRHARFVDMQLQHTCSMLCST
jgi:hypothetical protein